MFEDRLQIILKENNGEDKNIDFLFNDNTYFFDKVAEMHKFYSSSDFSLMYLSCKKGWVKKIMAIFIPKNEFSTIKEKLVACNKFLTGSNAEKKNEPKLLKVTSIIVMIIVALFGAIISYQAFVDIFF